MWCKYAAVCLLACLVAPCQAYFRGDPVQMFKRMQYQGKRSVWSDVLVGQGPLFSVDRAVELHYPSGNLPAQDTLKIQLSYDHEKFTSEWIMLNDGRGHQLDMVTCVIVYSGSEIHEVSHRLAYKRVEAGTPHADRVTIAYHWIKEVEEDTRSGLNFLFVAGCLLTGLAVIAVSLDSADLSQNRALLVPEYFDAAAKRPKVKQYMLFEGGENESMDAPSKIIGLYGGVVGSEHGLGDIEGLRGRASAAVAADSEVVAAASKAGGKGD